VRDASVEELQAVEGVGAAQARAIREFFHPTADARLIEGEGERMDPVPRRNG
jgi:ERCC4-type nuclease